MVREDLRLISVIIPCYNQGRYLSGAIESALAQDYPCKEIIVVNDGSTDNSAEVSAAFGNRIAYLQQSNRGVAAARNAGLRIAQGDYVTFLDSDDLYLPGALARQANFLDTHPDIGLVWGDAIYFDENGEIGRRSNYSGRPRRAQNCRWETIEHFPAMGTVMLRRDCFDTVGGFEEGLRNAAEDWHLWIRMSLRFDMAYLDEPITLCRVHNRSATRDRAYNHQGVRRAVSLIVGSPEFKQYPAHFRARLLFFRFATTWRKEPKTVSLGSFLRAITTDPTQIPFGLKVIYHGLTRLTARDH